MYSACFFLEFVTITAFNLFSFPSIYGNNNGQSIRISKIAWRTNESSSGMTRILFLCSPLPSFPSILHINRLKSTDRLSLSGLDHLGYILGIVVVSVSLYIVERSDLCSHIPTDIFFQAIHPCH